MCISTHTYTQTVRERDRERELNPIKKAVLEIRIIGDDFFPYIHIPRLLLSVSLSNRRENYPAASNDVFIRALCVCVCARCAYLS